MIARADVRTEFIETRRTARYATVCPPEQATDLWLVLHGYGQQAPVFAEQFARFSAPRRLIVAPEGLSRFYRRGMAGAVGASWMTSEAREYEIDDYVRYLDCVLAEAARDRPDLRNIHVLGFSQGAATAARWVCSGAADVGTLVLWGALPPPDIDLEKLQANSDRLILAVGTDDPYIEESLLENAIIRLHRAGLSPHVVRYAGGHELPPDALAQVIAQCFEESIGLSIRSCICEVSTPSRSRYRGSYPHDEPRKSRLAGEHLISFAISPGSPTKSWTPFKRRLANT